MWISEIVDQKEQRQAAGPVQHRHLQIFEGGKIAADVYMRPISHWRRIRNWLARRSLSLRLYDKPPN